MTGNNKHQYGKITIILIIEIYLFLRKIYNQYLNYCTLLLTLKIIIP